jgi:hypothetical protein
VPDPTRIPYRFTCERGLDLVSPVDRMPSGSYSYLFNTRVIEEGSLTSRPGYTPYSPTPGSGVVHSVRRLNDQLLGDGYVVGQGFALSVGAAGLLAPAASGLSGNPLSLIPFRPDNSPDSWMYVYDANKQLKLRIDSTVRDVGITPPNAAPTADYGPPEAAIINEGFDATGWTAFGTGSSPSLGDRTNSGAGPFNTILDVLYDSGSTGWVCLIMDLQTSWWAGERMRVVLNTGGGNQETVAVREIQTNIDTTTIQSINYDTGSNGLCSIVLAGSPSNLARNSIIKLTAEYVRVLSVTQSVDGTTYSLRCSTMSTHSAGETVTGWICWRAYTTVAHSAGEQVDVPCIVLGGTTVKGVGGMALLTNVDASKSTPSSRPIDEANDYMHCSVFLEDPENLVTLKLMIDIDADTTTLAAGAGQAFTRNYWTWTLTQAQVNQYIGGAGGSWTEVVVPIASGTRSGTDLTRNFSGIKAIQVEVNGSGGINGVALDGWYFMGTYGPTIIPNSPTGYLYLSRDRDSTTGAASVPGPQTRYQLFPLREEIIIIPASSSQAGVDSLDIYRQGGALTDFTYVGTAANNGLPFDDVQGDAIIASNPSPDLTLIAPWPVLAPARTGTVTVVGTSVLWDSGDQFDLTLLANTVILLNGVAYQVYGNPHSATFLEINFSGGTQVGVTYTIASPTLAAQPLAFAFGPLEGPFAPVTFALGDPLNPGTLYYTNASNPDAASDTNTIEITPPSEPLISGEVWNGLVFCGSHDNIFNVRYSYLTNLTIGVATGNPIVYQFTRIPAASGPWSRWASCRGPNGWYYLGRDGIYRATESGAQNITDLTLYPLFPHDGQPATPVVIGDGSNIIYPVDMTKFDNLRLSAGDEDLYFDYLDTVGNQVTLRYEIFKNRWFLHSYGDAICLHYLVENDVTSPDQPTLLLCSRAGNVIYSSGGDNDNNVDIECLILTASFDGGDQRLQKLYQDYIVDVSGVGEVSVAPAFNNSQTFGGVGLAAGGGVGVRKQSIINMAGDLVLYRNVSLKLAWTGGVNGPSVFAFEPSYYPQPFLSTTFITQYKSLTPGWSHHRRLFAGLISNGNVTLEIRCQDGRSYSVLIPGTGGRFKVQEQILPQDIKDLAFAYNLSSGTPFALFTDEFTIETKEWQEPSYIKLAVYKV